MPGIPLSSRADALTVTTRKDRSLKCIAPDNMATPDLCGKWFLLLYAACFCRSHYISLKIRYRGKQWEKKILQPGSNLLYPAASRSRAQKNILSFGAAIYGAVLTGTYPNFSSYSSCQLQKTKSFFPNTCPFKRWNTMKASRERGE